METIKKADLLRLVGAPVHVSNLTSPRTGNPVPNQFNIACTNGRMFQSYDSLVAVYTNGRLYLTGNHEYSVTTSKYATQWTGYTLKERRAGLASGEIVKIER